jgi:hypothetical protein
MPVVVYQVKTAMGVVVVILAVVVVRVLGATFLSSTVIPGERNHCLPWVSLRGGDENSHGQPYLQRDRRWCCELRMLGFDMRIGLGLTESGCRVVIDVSCHGRLEVSAVVFGHRVVIDVACNGRLEVSVFRSGSKNPVRLRATSVSSGEVWPYGKLGFSVWKVSFCPVELFAVDKCCPSCVALLREKCYGKITIPDIKQSLSVGVDATSLKCSSPFSSVAKDLARDGGAFSSICINGGSPRFLSLAGCSLDYTSYGSPVRVGHSKTHLHHNIAQVRLMFGPGPYSSAYYLKKIRREDACSALTSNHVKKPVTTTMARLPVNRSHVIGKQPPSHQNQSSGCGVKVESGILFLTLSLSACTTLEMSLGGNGPILGCKVVYTMPTAVSVGLDVSCHGRLEVFAFLSKWALNTVVSGKCVAVWEGEKGERAGSVYGAGKTNPDNQAPNIPILRNQIRALEKTYVAEPKKYPGSSWPNGRVKPNTEMTTNLELKDGAGAQVPTRAVRTFQVGKADSSVLLKDC